MIKFNNINKDLLRLMKYISKYRFRIFLVFLSAFILSLTSLASSYFIGKAIDYIIDYKNVDFENLIKSIGILIILYISGFFASLFSNANSVFISTNTIKDLRRDAFNKILNLPIGFFDKTSRGNIMSRFSNDMEAVSEGISQSISQFFSALITIVGSVIIMIRLNGGVAFVVIIVGPMALFIANFITTRSRKMFLSQQEIVGEYNGFVEESINNLKIVKAFSYEDEIENKAKIINNRLYSVGQKAHFYSALVNPATRFANNIAYVLIGLIGGISALRSGMSVGTITSLLSYSTQFSKPLNEITGITTQLQLAIASAGRIFEFLDFESESDESEKPDLAVSRGKVQFKNVSFSYNPKSTLIENFSIEIPAGSMVAIVGQTGAGKTTMVNLLMRFYEISGGQILIDGKNISDYNRGSIRKSFGMVLQDTWLFNGTVKENISYGKETATDEEVIKAAKASRAHSFIERLPEGYNTAIKEDGENISEGEKQLLTIARAMLSNSPMLILDEATSNVDPRTELLIQEAIKKLMENKTSFIIAHRLSTIKEADVIIVMDSGRIVEVGDHEELLGKKGLYYKMIYV